MIPAEARKFGSEDRVYAQCHLDEERARLNHISFVRTPGTTSDIIGYKS
jgi:hypothetical protein